MKTNILMPQEIEGFLKLGSPVAIGVSGGKDSCAVALALSDHLNKVGHSGPRILIHSDLGMVEWKDSLPTCERIAKAVGMELVTVRRAAGGMMERWEQRWENNVARYAALECVKIILPWSTPSMRFCTSELKSAVIASELKKRFGGDASKPILSVTGIRADESASRAKQPIFKSNPRLTRKSDGTHGVDWNAIHNWSTQSVFSYLEQKGFQLHQAYREFGSSRVSCAFCIMSSGNDLVAAAKCADNRELFVRMVDLEIASTFSFQAKWLADAAPHLLTSEQVASLAGAKEKAKERTAIEKTIPRHLEYEKGWPNVIPTSSEADTIADVRRKIGGLLGIEVSYTDGSSVIARYRQLMADKEAALRN